MSILFWAPGKLYKTNDLVQANTTGSVSQTAPDNADFELGDQDWTDDAAEGWSIAGSGAYEGTNCGLFDPDDTLEVVAAEAVASGRVGAATDADVWANAALPTQVTSMAGGNGKLAYAFTSVVRTSIDGITWTSQTSPTSNAIGAIDYAPDLDRWFLWEAAATAYFRSPTALTGSWSTLVSPFATHPTDFVWSRQLEMIVVTNVTTGTVFRSLNGEFWSLCDTTISAPRGVAWSPSLHLFVIVNAAGDVETSHDGVEWTLNAATGLTGGDSIAWSPTLAKFCIHDGANDNSALSSDGLSWTEFTGLDVGYGTSSTANARGVIWSASAGKFVVPRDAAASDNGSVLVSTDGQSWAAEVVEVGSFNFSVVAERGAALTYSTNDVRADVAPGQVVNVSAFVKSGPAAYGQIGIAWYDVSPALISIDWDDTPVEGTATEYRVSSVVAVAPADAVTAAPVIGAVGASAVRFDNVTWDQFFQSGKSGLLFKAVQVSEGFSGSIEPVWPTIVGNTVVDNEITWEAILANYVIWEAKSILGSSATEPTWPTQIGGGVSDSLISWIAESQNIDDKNCPNSKVVAVAASKVFAANKDVISFSATVNPKDWSTVDDAGFIPFGLNTYGSQDVSALGLYRSNLVAFNGQGFQMWQVDEDPANMAILDAVPVPCPYYASLQPFVNDLVFATKQGIRSMGIAGASTNLEAGFFGKQIDPLVVAAIASVSDDDDVLSLQFPAAGQYWLIIGAEAFVLTMNGGKKDMSWSRYVFPSAIDDWTLLNKELILRSGEKIWRFDEDTLIDDSGGANVAFVGEVWWPYLDFGALGQTKQMIGFDTVAEGEYKVVFGYNQNDAAQVTASYTILDGDTLVGDMIPMPISAPSFQMRLTFTGSTAWEWSASSLYLQDWRRTS